jgi:hypothetical protein
MQTSPPEFSHHPSQRFNGFKPRINPFTALRNPFSHQCPRFKPYFAPREKSDHLPPVYPIVFVIPLRPQTIFTLTEAKNRLLITYKMRSLEGMGLNIYPLLFAPPWDY